MYGYAGSILEVNLTTKKAVKRELTPEFAKKHIGGIGFNARILYDEIPKGADPLGEENILAFGAGTLVGTPFPTAARTEASAKSPITGLYGTSNSGAFFGLQLKTAGFDALIVKGRSEVPVYILIDDDKVEILDAVNLWGKDSWETIDILKERHKGSELALIGPAGENLVRFASIENGYFDGWGRTGLGAVMGSKKLKAVVVRGSKSITPKNPKAFMEAVREGRNLIQSASSYTAFTAYGTLNATIPYGRFNAVSAHNFTRGTLPDWEERCGKQVVDQYSNRHIACQSCIVACAHWVEIKEGKYKGLKMKDLEITPVISFAGTAGLDIEATMKACELSQKFGMDMLSTGGVLGFAIELFKNGLLTKEDIGYELEWGDDDTTLRLLEDIAYRRGVGDVLAEGVKRAALLLQKGEDCAMHVKGLEMPFIDPRGRWSTWVLGTLTNVRGGDFLRCRNPVENLRYNENKHDYQKERFGFKKPLYDQLDMPEELKEKIIDLKEDTVEIAGMSKWAEDLINLYNSIGVCIRPPIMEKVGPTVLARAYTELTGISITPEELMKGAEMTWNLIKLFNLREGEDINESKFPARFYNVPLNGNVLDNEKIQLVLKQYFQARGWDPSTSRPNPEKLSELGLDIQ